MKLADPRELSAKIRRQVFKPRTMQNTWQWSAKNVRLDSRFTARPGYYDVNFTPYMKMPHEWFSDPHVQEITSAKSRQVAGSTWLGNCMMYAVGEDPGPIMYVTTTLTNAQSYSEREWQPRTELSPLLSKLKPDSDDDFKKLEQHYKTCTVRLMGSNSQANLMSRPVRWLFLDEIDAWPKNDGDASPLDTVEACTISYAHARKILRVSTPTVPTGPIWVKFLQGTQHKYHVPCPCCNHKWELLFEHMNFHRDECRSESGVWDLELLREKASITCPNCKHDIPQFDQPDLVMKGEWVQTNPNAPRRHISWHISALYSSTLTWGEIAVLFMQKKDTAGGLHDFYNHYLGLPFSNAATAVTISDVERVRDSSPSYVVWTPKNHDWVMPGNPAFIVGGVDVQQDGFWWAHRGLMPDKTSFLIDYGQASTWDDLTELAQRRYKAPNGSMVGLWKSVIDCGYKAKRMGGVYDFVHASGGRYIACQGRSIVHGLYQAVREVVFAHKEVDIDGIQLRDDILKEWLYIQKLKLRAGSGWWLPRNISETYKKQLTNESVREKVNERGETYNEWFTTGNNHLGDVEKYILALIELIVPFMGDAPTPETPVETVVENLDEHRETVDPFANIF